ACFLFTSTWLFPYHLVASNLTRFCFGTVPLFGRTKGETHGSDEDDPVANGERARRRDWHQQQSGEAIHDELLGSRGPRDQEERYFHHSGYWSASARRA